MGEAELAEIAALKKLAVAYDEDEGGDWYIKRLGNIKKAYNKASLRESKGKSSSARAPADAAAGDDTARVFYGWKSVQLLEEATEKGDCLAWLEETIEEAGTWKCDAPHQGVCTIDGVGAGLTAYRHYAEMDGGDVCRVRLVDLGDRGWVVQMPKAAIARGAPLERDVIDLCEDDGDDEPVVPPPKEKKKKIPPEPPKPAAKKAAAEEDAPTGRGKRQKGAKPNAESIAFIGAFKMYYDIY